MPDTSSPLSLGAPEHKGIPEWVMVVGAIAGIAGLILLLKNQGQGTVAAGSSINASLGSIQEEILNAQGQEGLNAAAQRDLTRSAASALSQQNIAQTRAIVLDQNAVAGRIIQQTSTNPATVDSWTQYINDILPGQNAAYAQAVSPIQLPSNEILFSNPSPQVSSNTGTF